MMKCGINTLLWPYTAVVMHDETNHICVTCEGIVCGERFDMYTAHASFFAKYAPGRGLCTVQVVTGDGFLTKTW
jgi:hypothetical protein